MKVLLRGVLAASEGWAWQLVGSFFVDLIEGGLFENSMCLISNESRRVAVFDEMRMGSRSYCPGSLVCSRVGSFAVGCLWAAFLHGSLWVACMEPESHLRTETGGVTSGSGHRLRLPGATIPIVEKLARHWVRP